jgi:putative ABC transport system permease protein
LVITYALWQRRYNGARDVIGRRLTIAEQPFTIVGVMPSDFTYPRGVEAWMTLAALTSMVNPAFRQGAARDVDLIARLRPGVTIDQASSELQVMMSRLDAIAPADANRGFVPVVHAFKDVVVGDVRAAMLVLFAAVGLVLLIASANVANLLLLRGEARRPELAVRAALGAGQGRLARQMFIEALLLAFTAGAIGVIVTRWTLQALIALIPYGLPRIEVVRVDTAVVFFAVAVAVLTAAFAGLAPSLSAARVDLASQLRSGSGSGGRGVLANPFWAGRRLLVVAQAALAVIVVGAAGLLIHSLLRLQTVDMGLAADRLVLVAMNLPQSKYGDRERRLRFLNETVARLQTTPGIAAATPIHTAPFAGTNGWDLPEFTAEGQSADQVRLNPPLNLESIYPTYFRTFEIPIVRGRAFADTDRHGAPDVAIVSEDVATRLWPGQDPLGKRLKFGDLQSTDSWLTIVGVARPTRYRELTHPRPTLYLPAEQFIVASESFMLRTDATAPLTRIADLTRDTVRSEDPDVHVMRVMRYADLLDRPLAAPRFNAWLTGVFGISALLLVLIGLYGVIGAYVTQRRAEIAIRMALGATTSDVRQLVLGEGLKLAGIGVAIGLVATLGTTRLLRGLLYGVEPLDPAALLATALLLVIASSLASYLPARRAARVDPVTLLRSN